jgi:hypothetical protein
MSGRSPASRSCRLGAFTFEVSLMARRSRSSRSSSSPNKILVVLLVLFILTTIGEGVWAYSLLKEKDKWDKAPKEKDDVVAAEKYEQAWCKYKCDELMAAIAGPKFFSSEGYQAWKDTRTLFEEERRFVNATDRETFKGIMKELEDKLGGFKTGTGYYATLFDLRIDKDKLEPFRTWQDQGFGGPLAKETAEKKLLVEKLNSMKQTVADDRKFLEKMITLGNQKSLEQRKEQNNATTKMIETNEKLRAELDDIFQGYEKEKAKLRLEIKALSEKVQAQELVQKNPNRALVDPHALMLDLSRGKTLWDTPRAKVVRIDESGKKVYIDKGSKDGVKVGLTFLAFAAGWQNRGEGPLKATLEVVRVDDDHTAVCRINTYYDIDGREIAANEATPSKILRDGAGALKEGDLLFNLVWGMHVAVVGIIDFTGYGGNTPAAQKDNLDEFILHLNRMGVIVDAYMDPRDGKIVGAVSTKTNLVIRGGSAGSDTKDERQLSILTALKYMRDQAVERGLFIISPENFAVVTGYRRPGSADKQQTLTFQPRPPSGGGGLVGDTQELQDQQDKMKK